MSGAGGVMGAKVMKKNMHNSNFNQSKYISGGNASHNNSVSPASQTFFKESKNKNQNSPIGVKKGWPTTKKKNMNNMYVSSYSKNPNQK